MAELEQLPSRPDSGVTLLEVLISMLILSIAVGFSSQFISSATNHHKIKVGYSHLLEFIDQTQHRVLSLDVDSPLRIKSVHQ
ncbi:MAG: prepilin-type N-terminal cleavage/methylation domain-containing protein, partial [Proteobacteria bacterium]|nr:prepilin-type N-terminal cleavage/methylation domain-containing protein [Pseudomonadota bacterium]